MWETTKGNKMYLSGELEVWERTADELHLPPACPTIIIQSDTVKIKRWEKHNAWDGCELKQRFQTSSELQFTFVPLKKKKD